MIREYNPKDIDNVNKLLSEFNFKLTEESFHNDFFKILVYQLDYVVAVLVYKYMYDRIEIEYIVVEEKYRKFGIATKLLSHLEAKYKGIKNITLEVRKSNLIARKFYEKNGFTSVAIRKNYYFDEDGILMLKELGE